MNKQNDPFFLFALSIVFAILGAVLMPFVILVKSAELIIDKVGWTGFIFAFIGIVVVLILIYAVLSRACVKLYCMFADRTVESRKARALEKAKEEIYKKHPRLRAGRLSAQETESELAAVEKEILLAKYKINNDFRDLQNVADVYREEKRLKQEQKRQKSTKNRPRNKFPSGR